MRLRRDPRRRPRTDRSGNFAGGGILDPDKSQKVTVSDLTPNTSYLILAAALNGTTYSQVAKLPMTTLKDESDPYTKLNIKNAWYMGDTDGAGNWLLKFVSDHDTQGNYVEVFIGIWSQEIPADLSNLSLPTGTFTASAEHTAGTYDTDTSFQRSKPDGTIYNFVGGKVEITKEGSIYTLQAELLDDGKYTRLYRFTGPVVGEDESPHHLPRIAQDVDATFDTAEGTYYGDYFKNGTSAIDIAFTTGQTLLNVEFICTAAPYGNDALAAGTYSVGENHAEMTYMPGVEYNAQGWEYIPTGTYCQIKSGETSSYAFATGGTITVEKSGADYTIAFDLTTAENIAVRGSYSGALTLADGTEKPVISELEEDHVLDLSAITTGLMEWYGDWPYGNGLDMWAIEFKDLSIDGIDGIQFELFLEPNGFLEEGVPTGTYHIDPVAAANTLVPGFIAAYTAGCWYLWDNQNGTYGKKAPLNSGTLTIGRDGDNWTFDIDVYDDARPAHHITGHWSGPVEIK